MHYRSGSQIREDFLRFFEGKAHRRVHSSSLVPANDPTLLFANAGMNQFKDVFLGAEQRPYTRATSSQKCVRAGGKHNDLENVGFTRRHHTFFEMLGNFSFGDYFKRDAIAFAWELLTSPDWFGIPPEKLYVTIFEGEGSAGGSSPYVPRDVEAEELWVGVGVPRERIVAMPGKDNFWQMGETGPCGPCSEIFYDLGLAASETVDAQGQPVDKPFPEDDQRYVEIWNLVFMQFDRAADGTLTPLPKPSIDTGMGLERIAAVLQGKLSNYETDLFTPLIARAGELVGYEERLKNQLLFSRHPDLRKGYSEQMEEDRASLRIIADHARAVTFLISDGVMPSNEGRGYVLRKILRRAIRHGRELGTEVPFMYEMVLAVKKEMSAAYPQLIDSAKQTSEVVQKEEEQFSRVIARGLSKFEELMEEMWIEVHEEQSNFLRALAKDRPGVGKLFIDERKSFSPRYGEIVLVTPHKTDIPALIKQEYGDVLGEPILKRWTLLRQKRVRIPGDRAFAIYESYGLPLDFMIDICRDAEAIFDMEGFERAKEEEQARARASWKGGAQKTAAPVYRELQKTEFEGYTATRLDGARVLALVKDGVGVPSLAAGEQGEVVLDATSFYADSGGQVGDVGVLTAADHVTVVAEVLGCTKPVQGLFAHRVTAREAIAVGDFVDTVVDAEIRRATMRNHTGTHLLQAALREVLGTHVKQAGSLNDRARLRFDFSHFAQVAEPELEQVEGIVNAHILANTPVQTLVDVPIDVAVNELYATALFGEKYGDRVRVVKIGDFSTELCGGTHTEALGEIGLLKLTGESSVSSGVRRLEAVTGMGSLAAFRRDAEVARVAAQFAGGTDVSPAAALEARLAAADEETKRLRRELEQMRMKSAAASTANAAETAVEVAGVKLLAQRVDGVDKTQMRSLVDTLRAKLGTGVVVLGAANDGRVSLIVGVTKDLTGRVQAGKLVGQLAALVGGKGGGRPDLAEAGGADAGALDGALAKAPEILQSLLG